MIYRANSKAWMRSDIFIEWLRHLDHYFRTLAEPPCRNDSTDKIRCRGHHPQQGGLVRDADGESPRLRSSRAAGLRGADLPRP